MPEPVPITPEDPAAEAYARRWLDALDEQRTSTTMPLLPSFEALTPKERTAILGAAARVLTESRNAAYEAAQTLLTQLRLLYGSMTIARDYYEESRVKNGAADAGETDEALRTTFAFEYALGLVPTDSKRYQLGIDAGWITAEGLLVE